MIEIHPLAQFDPADLIHVASGYSTNGKYIVSHTDSENHASINLQFTTLDEPYVKKYDPYDNETLQHYNHILNNGYSFGAYDNRSLIGFLLAEPHEWNRSLWVWEFHVAETHRNRGIGKRLMESAAENAKRAKLRTIVCETQNTNVIAIKVYRKLGFSIEGIDISYYSNDDYPDGEVAVFMKRRL